MGRAEFNLNVAISIRGHQQNLSVTFSRFGLLMDGEWWWGCLLSEFAKIGKFMTKIFYQMKC